MSGRARRLLSGLLHRSARRAWPVLCALTAILAVGATNLSARTICVEGDGRHIRQVCLEQEPGAPVYGHNILGDTPEWNSVVVFWGTEGQSRADGHKTAATLTQAGHVFEDIGPRLVDLDADGLPEILLVQSSFQSGSRLIVLGTDGAVSLLASTPYIGRSNRWLAPLGAADLDGDGHVEIAYIDRPHLARTLRIWRYTKNGLAPVADQPGLTNHKIGEPFISGGIRQCGPKPQVITANANWTRIIASTVTNDQINTKDIGPFTGPASLVAALSCS